MFLVQKLGCWQDLIVVCDGDRLFLFGCAGDLPFAFAGLESGAFI